MVPCGSRAPRVEIAGPHHRAQHRLSPPARRLRIVRRRQLRRRADEPRQHRALGQVERFRFLAEIPLRCRRDAVSPRPEISGVEVASEDLVFAEPCLEPQSNNHLLHLPAQRTFRGQISQPDELLGDRAGPFKPTAATQIVPSRAQNAAEIDPAMRVEPPVFDRHDGMDEIRRQSVDADPIALHDAANRKDFAVGAGKGHCRGGRVGIAGSRSRQSHRTIADEAQDQDGRRRAGPPQRDGNPMRTSSRRPPHTASNICPFFTRNEIRRTFVPKNWDQGALCLMSKSGNTGACSVLCRTEGRSERLPQFLGLRHHGPSSRRLRKALLRRCAGSRLLSIAR